MTSPAAQVPANTGMGGGVNQRDKIKMSQEEIDDFLAERNSMSMATIDDEGRIHLVAMWYGFLEGAWRSRPRPSRRRSPTCAAIPG